MKTNAKIRTFLDKMHSYEKKMYILSQQEEKSSQKQLSLHSSKN